MPDIFDDIIDEMNTISSTMEMVEEQQQEEKEQVIDKKGKKIPTLDTNTKKLYQNIGKVILSNASEVIKEQVKVLSFKDRMKEAANGSYKAIGEGINERINNLKKKFLPKDKIDVILDILSLISIAVLGYFAVQTIEKVWEEAKKVLKPIADTIIDSLPDELKSKVKNSDLSTVLRDFIDNKLKPAFAELKIAVKKIWADIKRFAKKVRDSGIFHKMFDCIKLALGGSKNSSLTFVLIQALGKSIIAMGMYTIMSWLKFPLEAMGIIEPTKEEETKGFYSLRQEVEQKMREGKTADSVEVKALLEKMKEAQAKSLAENNVLYKQTYSSRKIGDNEEHKYERADIEGILKNFSPDVSYQEFSNQLKEEMKIKWWRVDTTDVKEKTESEKALDEKKIRQLWEEFQITNKTLKQIENREGAFNKELYNIQTRQYILPNTFSSDQDVYYGDFNMGNKLLEYQQQFVDKNKHVYDFFKAPLDLLSTGWKYLYDVLSQRLGQQLTEIFDNTEITQYTENSEDRQINILDSVDVQGYNGLSGACLQVSMLENRIEEERSEQILNIINLTVAYKEFKNK